jgi:HD-like signal output (HDOD) protein
VQLASLEIRIARSENLPVLPQAVSQVLKLADDPDSSARDLEKVIERDPAITAKVLRVANSAYYGSSNVSSIGRAISFLGMNTIRSLVVGVAFQQLISGRQQCLRFNKIEYWRHSLAVGIGARILGKLRMPARAEELYCAGMMHDVGMLVLDRFVPSEYDSVLEEAQGKQRPMDEVERELLTFDHAAVGGLLAQKWALTPMIHNAIKYHHEPVLDGDYYETTCYISAANALAHHCGFTNNQVGEPPQIDDFMADAIGLPKEQFDIIRNVMVTEVLKAQDSFHIAA